MLKRIFSSVAVAALLTGLLFPVLAYAVAPPTVKPPVAKTTATPIPTPTPTRTPTPVPVAGQEIVGMRTENSKSFYINSTTMKQVVSVGVLHYKDNYASSVEPWKDIDLTIVGGKITKAPYTMTQVGTTITVKDKRTGSEVVITPKTVGNAAAKAADFMVVPSAAGVKIQRKITSKAGAAESSFDLKVTGKGLDVLSLARGVDGKSIEVQAEYKNGKLTERVDTAKIPADKFPLLVDPSVVVSVSASDDDASHQAVTGINLADFTETAGDLFNGAAGTDFSSGMRFLAVAAPNATTIMSATLQLTAHATATVFPTTVIDGEDVGNSVAFTTAANYVGRPRTAASIAWTPTAWVSGTAYTSTDISSVIQEVVNRGDWASGNDLALFWRDAPGWGGVASVLTASSWDDATTAPQLTLYHAILPTVVTNAATNIRTTAATFNGNVTNLGYEATVDYRGFVWDTVTHGDPGNVDPSATAYTVYYTAYGPFGVGAYTYRPITLVDNTTYFVRAVTHNILGWDYGAEVTFDTLHRVLWLQPNAILASDDFSGTADAGGSATTLVDAALTQVDNYWRYGRLTILTTTDGLAPQSEVAIVTGFTDATNTLAFAAGLSATVDAGDTYIVSYATLPDRSVEVNTATIGWGENPTGVAVSMGSMSSSTQISAAVATSEPSQEVAPEVPVSDWYVAPDVSGALLTNPFRPFVLLISDNTTLTELQTWRWYGLLFVIGITVLAARNVRGHQMLTGIASGAAIVVLVVMTIWPLWALVFVAGSVLGGMIAERMGNA